jgi:hypothetical protein
VLVVKAVELTREVIEGLDVRLELTDPVEVSVEFTLADTLAETLADPDMDAALDADPFELEEEADTLGELLVVTLAHDDSVALVPVASCDEDSVWKGDPV